MKADISKTSAKCTAFFQNYQGKKMVTQGEENVYRFFTVKNVIGMATFSTCVKRIRKCWDAYYYMHKFELCAVLQKLQIIKMNSSLRE